MGSNWRRLWWCITRAECEPGHCIDSWVFTRIKGPYNTFVQTCGKYIFIALWNKIVCSGKWISFQYLKRDIVEKLNLFISSYASPLHFCFFRLYIKLFLLRAIYQSVVEYCFVLYNFEIMTCDISYFKCMQISGISRPSCWRFCWGY